MATVVNLRVEPFSSSLKGSLFSRNNHLPTSCKGLLLSSAGRKCQALKAVSSLVSQTTKKDVQLECAQVDSYDQENASALSLASAENFSIAGLVESLLKPAFAAFLVGALLCGNPGDALAAQGGGRVGGKNFSASRERMYSPPVRSSTTTIITPGPTYVTPYYAPTPFFGGWGWSPFSFWAGPSVTVGVGGGGFGLFGFLLFGILIFVVANAVTGYLSQGGDDEDDFYGTSTISVVKLQVGLLGLARNLQRSLDQMAMSADTNTPEGLHKVLSETVLSLLRNPEYCVYGCAKSEEGRDSYNGEELFNRMVMLERSKFREETLLNVGGDFQRLDRAPKPARMNSEFIVVTIVAATEGDFSLPPIRSSEDLRQALVKLGSISSDQLQAIEVLWTPQNEEDTLSQNDILRDFPELMSL
eukprot:TRINITY_DN694_c0_g1_i5.p1 TRINITY_DN694_c0_g1~~TRINITY_DN694_c0_g1_i5.p1  ORF type:complete len:415 (-),score=88.99 TRINITY_DN694_c0_g1_i5:197-1441(-)